MEYSEKEWIRKWNPYDNVLELTREILDEFNSLADSGKNASKLELNSTTEKYLNTISDLNAKFTLRVFRGNKIPKDLLSDLFKLTRANMKGLYDSAKFYGGWNDKKKFSELKYYKTHVIAILNGLKHSVNHFSASEVVGFASYRFVVMRDNQNPTPVLYIYELQVKDKYRCHGLGGFLIHVLKLVGKAASCKKLMCTVIRMNERALSFYVEKCKFESDESDPNVNYMVLKLEL